MKAKTIFRKLLSCLLLVAMFLGLIPASITGNSYAAQALPTAEASSNATATRGPITTGSSWDWDGDGTLSILAIGNSFSSDAMEYVWNIANNLGIKKMHLGNLYISGCSLATHASNAANDSAAYTYYVNTGGSWSSTASTKMSTALTSRSWDFVTLQQASPNSGQESTYNEDLTYLISYVKSKLKNPDATKLAWHMTWAYQANSTHSGFANYNKNQTTMYDAIISAVKNKIVPNKDIDIIIPTGTAIQNLRSSIVGDTVTRDGYHLSYGVGRYTAALMFVKQLTGLSIDNVTWKSTSTALSSNGEEKFLAIEAVNFAYKTPLAKTSSYYTGKTDPTWNFVQTSPTAYKWQYWYSTGDYHTNRATTSDVSNAKQYCCTQKLSKTGTTNFNHYLPVGSLIVVSSNYRIRPEGWKSTGKQTGSRPAETDDNYIIVTEEWWGSYTQRAFNVSKDDDSDWTDGFQIANLNHYFRIYIPIELVTEYYYQYDIDFTFNKYWNSTNSQTMNNTTTANKNIFFGAHLPSSVSVYDPAQGKNITKTFSDLRFTKEMLPENQGLVSLRTGYKMREDGWTKNGATNTNDTRPGEKHTNLQSTGTSWWGSWTLRGFNLSFDDERDNSNNTPSTMESYILRLYGLRSLYPCAVELEKELDNAEKYVMRGNRDGLFPADLYAEFTRCVNESEALFGHSHTVRTIVPAGGEIKTAMETARNHQAHKLKKLVDQLAYYESEVNSSSFIDLPVEVLDFRADGLLFDNYNVSNPYALSTASPTIKNALTGATMNRPGQVYTDSNNVSSIENLTLPELVGGELIYRPETVTYVAHALAQKLLTFSDTGNIDTTFKDSYYHKNWNSLFMTKVTGGFGTNDMTVRLGTWSDTLKKVGLNQGLDGTKEGTNGGKLLYTQITTAYDLAYYMLNNIWRATDGTDPLVDGSGTPLTRPDGQPLTYNTVVKELDTIRLIKTGTDTYSFTSNNDVGRDLTSGTLFNTSNTKLVYSPKLNAVSELGFEHPSVYGPVTTGIAGGRGVTTMDYYANYDYMIHAKGAFVYYKGKNLYFTFTGDDDVYFYINGSLACDVGGMHSAVTRSRNLNDIADSLGLVDGDICTFDMFLVDRHTSEVNLNFTTNIELMSAEAITTEPQRDFETGAAISNNAIVADGTEVAFSFDLLNRSDYHLANVTFQNQVLESYLSPDSLRLNHVDGNSLDEQVGNLVITYTSYDPKTGKYTQNKPEPYTAAEYETLKSIIQEARNSDSVVPIVDQAFEIRGISAAQLMELLELGIPCNVRMSVYGFHHTVYANVGTYENVVNSTSYPVRPDGTLGTPIFGTASTKVQAKRMESYVEAPLRVVIDYGKPVEFSPEDIQTLIRCAKGASTQYIGMNLQGSHGQISDYMPNGMIMASPGETYKSWNGIYEHLDTTFRFTLHRLLEEVERINTVFEIREPGVSATWYLMVAVEIIPATMVYYEAEDFTDKVFSYEEQSAEGTKKEFDVVRQNDHKQVSDAALTSYLTSPDPTNDQDMLYFGFNNTAEDVLRYQKNPIYGGEQLDGTAEWWHDGNVSAASVSVANGNISFTGTPTSNFLYIGSGKDNSGNRNYPLRYTPSAQDWLEIRFRIDGTAVANSNMHFKIEFFHKTDSTVTNHYNYTYYFAPDSHEDGYYVISDYIGCRTLTDTTSVTGTTSSMSYGELPLITRVNLLFGGLANSQSQNISIDYFYVGPREDRPSAQGRHLMFDFSNSAAAQYRYSSQLYKYTNYDLTDSWQHYAGRTASMSVDGGVLKMTPNPSNTSYLYWARTEPIAENYNNLNYTPGITDYCQVRIKVENAEALSPDSPYFALYFSADGKEIPDANSTFCYFDLSEDTLGKWFTLSFPITNPLWYEADAITTVHLQLGGMKGISEKEAAFYIDYCYVGPSQPQDLNLAGAEAEQYMYRDDVLYFDFSADPEAAKRYAQPLYHNTNYDDKTKWYVNANRNSLDVAGGSLQLKINAPYDAASHTDIKNCNPFAQTTTSADNAKLIALNYIPTATDCVQARLRFVNCKLMNENSSLAFRVYFMANKTPHESHGVLPNDFLSKNLDSKVVSEGNWFTINVPANDVFRNAQSIDALRVTLINVVSASSEPGIVEIDYLFAGPAELAPDAEVYGYDTSYKDDRGLSDGESLFIEGQGAKSNTAPSYSQASFSFKGTGFDLISRTGMEQGTIKVNVIDEAGNTVESISRNNKGELELYQIPVVSVEDLPYGRYTVTIDVFKAINMSGAAAIFNRGGEFYFDAVRIYDPINAEENADANNAYLGDLEAYPFRKEVRDVLLSANDFNALTGTADGAVFIDQAKVDSSAPDAGNSTEHITDLITTYESLGPKNEVYLNAGQSIAFKLRLNTVQTPVSIDIGAKAIYNNDTPVLTVGHTTTTTAPAQVQAWDVQTNTALYYPANITEANFATDADGRYLYLVISNKSENSVLSITDLKFGYDSEPTLINSGEASVKRVPVEAELVSFLVDGGIAEAVSKVRNAELAEEDTVILDENIAIKHTLNLASDIAINFAVSAESLSQYEGYYLECALYDGSIVRIEPVLKGNHYYFTLTGLTAVNMNDEVRATLHMSKDGMKFTSSEDRYSISQYAYSQLSKEESPKELKSLCADLLRYGSAAQIYKNYRTNHLADVAMTPALREYLTDLETLTFGNTNEQLSDLPNPTVTWVGKALNLESKVALKYVIDLSSYQGDLSALSLQVSYVDYTGRQRAASVTTLEEYNAAKKQYAFSFDELLAAELRCVVSVAVFEGNTQLSNTLRYSPDTYGANKTGALDALCKALFAYSDSAKAYFAEPN